MERKEGEREEVVRPGDIAGLKIAACMVARAGTQRDGSSSARWDSMCPRRSSFAADVLQRRRW